jgi:hypothetical protein
MKSFFQTIGLVLITPVVVMVAFSKPIVTFGVRFELNKFARAVRASDRMLEEKEKLVDRIDAVEKLLSNENRLSIFAWITHIEDIRDMLKDGITADEVRLIERELEKIEQELNP